MALPFIASSRRGGDTWFSVGHIASFPNITESVTLSEQQLCGGEDNVKQVGCKVFLAPDADSKEAIQISDDPKDQVDISLRRGEQVLVFQFKGKIHAMDNVRANFTFVMQVLISTEMSSLIISAFQWRGIRYRGLRYSTERWYQLPQTRVVI